MGRYAAASSQEACAVQDSENLRYCEMDIKDAPGLQDPRHAPLTARLSAGLPA